MTRVKRMKLLRVACYLTLVSLELMAWAIIHPTPLAVIAAMSIGQAIGIFAVLCFIFVVLPDLKSALQGKEASPPPPPPDDSSSPPDPVA